MLVLLVVGLVVLVDLLLAGGALTGTCASGLMAVMAHPVGWLLLALVAVVLLVVSGMEIAPWR